MSEPAISVVMSVYNGQRYLRESIESVLAQTHGDFEFLIVNDGSTDGSRDILAGYEREDSRVRVLDQENRGLTLALIRGCQKARGQYIARQDADDVSLPSRLGAQAAYLARHADVTLLSCWTRFIGPEGEELSLIERRETPAEATEKMRCMDLSRIQGVSGHGSTMFRRSDYQRAGGYRRQCWAAQDLDLWLRLTDFGLVAFLPQILYLARFTDDCISMRSHAVQLSLAGVILGAAKARQAGRSDEEWLRAAEAVRRPCHRKSRRDRAKGSYFIGKCLMDQGDRRGMKYLRQAIRQNPFHLPAWAALLRKGLPAF